MAEEGREAHPQGGESLDGHKGSLGIGQSFTEVGRSGHRVGKPVAQPRDLVFRLEDRAIQVDRSIGDWGSVPVRAPVDELCLGD